MRSILLALIFGTILLFPASADPVFTGNAAHDFNIPGAQMFFDDGMDQWRDYVIPTNHTMDVGLPNSFTNGEISGWDINATYFYYNKSSDTLYAGIDFYGIGGDADGDGDPSSTSSNLSIKGGVDWPDLTEEESICMSIDTNFDGWHEYVVGISGIAEKDDFGLYNLSDNMKAAPALGFGEHQVPDPSHLFCIPNSICPDFEFYITNFSRLRNSTFTPGESFRFRARPFAGSYSDDGIGEDIGRAWVYYNYTDFGDAPASYGTLLADQGANHTIIPGLCLGAQIDDEVDGQPDDNAMGDDLSGKDDEDGVSFGPLYTGDDGTIMVNATLNATINATHQARLNAWMDFNRDGDWSEPDEHIIDNWSLRNGSNYNTMHVPLMARPGPTFARFRLSTIGNLSATGPAPDGSVPDGEVEDYNVIIFRPEIEVNKTALPDSGAPCTDINFTIRVTNHGTVNLDNVTAEDTLPDGLRYVRDNHAGILGNDGKTVAWRDLGSLKSNESTFVNLTVHVDGTVFGTLTNQVNVSGSPSGGHGVNNSTTTNVTALKPEIEVNKTATPSSGAPSTKINFTIRVTNTGNVILNTVETRDTLPAGLNYVLNSSNGTESDGVVTWSNLGPIEPNISIILHFIAHINGSRFGNLTNFVKVRGYPPTGNPVNNSTQVDVAAFWPNIEVNKTADPESGAPSTNISFTIKVTNTGNITLNVEANDTLPFGLNYVKDDRNGTESKGVVTWPDLGSLKPNESTFIHLIAHINGSRFGNLANRVNVTGQPPTGNNVTNSSETNVTAIPARIEVNKTAEPDSGAPSTRINFTIKVTNTGNVTLNTVGAKDTLPFGLNYVSDDRNGTESNGVVTWSDLSSLDPSESTLIHLIAYINGKRFGNLTNLVNVTGQPPTGNRTDNSTKVNITAFKPGIEVNKTANPDSGAPLINITFTINVTNTGNISLKKVKARDTLPEGLRYVSDDRNGTELNGEVTWPDLGPLDLNKSTLIHLIASIDGTRFGNLTNRVNVIGRPPTGDPVNASATANVTAIPPNIEVIKTADPDSGAPSTILNFTIKVTNAGKVNLTTVEAMDTLPFGLNYVSDDRNGTETNGVVTWPDLGSLDLNKSTLIHLLAHINGQKFGKLTNRVDVTGRWNTNLRATGQPFAGNSISNYTELDVTALLPNIEAKKIADPDSGAPSTKINFTIKVTNTGKVMLKTVEAKDTLPFGLNYISDDRNGTESHGVVTWPELGSLEPNNSTLVHLFAHINGSRFGNLTNRMNVTGHPPTGNPVNNSTATNVTAFRPEIKVTKKPVPDIGVNSTKINFTINVINIGNIALDLVEAKDTLPAGLSYVWDDSGGTRLNDTIVWRNLGSLMPEGSRSIQLVTNVDGDVLGNLTNLVNVTGKPLRGDSVTNLTTANVTIISLSVLGRKFNDLNGNGTHDGDPDPGIPNWTIELVNATTGQAVRTILTNESGLYRFDDVPRGSYIVREEHRFGWNQTCPPDPGYYSITVDSADVNEMDFGNQEVHSVFGHKFNDQNGNGIRDVGELGLQGWEMKLINETSGLVVKNAITDGDGFYHFDNVTRGGYTLREVMQDGWNQTCPAGGNYSIAIDHTDVSGMDFGNKVEVYSISGHKFNDTNGDGIWDAGEDGLLGWEIELVNETSLVVKSATDSDGLYHFDNVPRGSYTLRELQQDGWNQTCPVGGNYSVTINHSDMSGLDFGNYKLVPPAPAALGDFVWQDKNMNGIQDQSETGWPGVVVKLYRAEGSALSRSPGNCLGETKTDSDGIYKFTDLEPGSYLLKFEKPPGCRFCPCDQCPDEKKDCDADCDGWTEVIQLQNGQTDLSWDAGILPNSSLDVKKDASPKSGSPGAEIGFDIEIRNSGETDLSHVKATDTLPEGMTYVSNNRSGSAAGRIITWDDLGNLTPGGSTGIHLVARIDRNVSGWLTNIVVASARDPSGGEVNDTDTASVQSLLPNIDVIKQYSQYCEDKKIKGEGLIESSTKMVDKRIALDYDDAMAGEGEVEIDSARSFSEAADKLQREVPSLDGHNKSNLNFFEQSKLDFKGSKPLTGEKSIQSKEFYGGSGTRIRESFSTDRMEKSQAVYFGSTPASNPHFVGMDLKSSFKGTVETDSIMHRMLSEDIASRQRFSGIFELEKAIKLREKATKAARTTRVSRTSGCEDIDC